MNRKIIQISVTSGASGEPDFIYALCDDGTLWFYDTTNIGKWKRVSLEEMKKD